MSYALVRLEPLEVITTFPVVPNPLVWPNGDASHAVSVGEERAGFRLVEMGKPAFAPDYHEPDGEVTLSIEGNTVTRVQAWAPIALKEVQTSLALRIDDAAEAERLKHVTQGSGQAMVYAEKLREAIAYLADTAPDPAHYPLILDAADAAAVVAKSKQWAIVAGKIERVRLGAKAAVTAATTVPDAVAVWKALQWPSS